MRDPFLLLSVDKTATKQEILSSVTAALRERRQDAKLIAEAQKELFNPVSRAAAEFTHFIDTSGCIDDFAPEVVPDGAVPVLEMLDYVNEKGTAESQIS
jgi:hypothetical protein